MINNPFSNPTMLTLKKGREIYRRKQKGETLESLSREFGYTYIHTSRLYNWYKTFQVKKGKKA